MWSIDTTCRLCTCRQVVPPHSTHPSGSLFHTLRWHSNRNRRLFNSKMFMFSSGNYSKVLNFLNLWLGVWYWHKVIIWMKTFHMLMTIEISRNNVCCNNSFTLSAHKRTLSTKQTDFSLGVCQIIRLVFWNYNEKLQRRSLGKKVLAVQKQWGEAICLSCTETMEGWQSVLVVQK